MSYTFKIWISVLAASFLALGEYDVFIITMA